MAEFYTVEELAGYLRLTKRTIYRLLKGGNIPSVKVGHKWRFNKEFIDEWLNPPKGGAKKRILVIDDDPIIDLLFKEALEDSGHTIVTASTSAQGLEYVERLEFDLAFLDLKMPKMDGAELLRQIKKIRPELPITIITGYPDSEIMSRALEQGSFTIMKKPFGKSEIINIMNTFFGIGKAR